MQNFLNRLIKIKNNLKNLLLVTDSKKQSLGSLDTGYIQLNNKLNNKGLSRERLSVISANSYKLVTKFIGNIINNQGKNSFTLWIDMNYRFAPSICNISNKKNMYLLREDDFKKTVKIYEILLKTQAIDLVVLEISQYLAAKYDISKYLKIMTIML